MKKEFNKHFRKLAVLTAVILGFSLAGSAQVYVHIRPSVTVVERPVRPSPRHVWVEEEWSPRGGRYEHVAGYWTVPPRRGAIWVAGRWRAHRADWVWVPGHWSR